MGFRITSYCLRVCSILKGETPWFIQALSNVANYLFEQTRHVNINLAQKPFCLETESLARIGTNITLIHFKEMGISGIYVHAKFKEAELMAGLRIGISLSREGVFSERIVTGCLRVVRVPLGAREGYIFIARPGQPITLEFPNFTISALPNGHARIMEQLESAPSPWPDGSSP